VSQRVRPLGRAGNLYSQGNQFDFRPGCQILLLMSSLFSPGIYLDSTYELKCTIFTFYLLATDHHHHHHHLFIYSYFYNGVLSSKDYIMSNGKIIRET
jgi:hypothetical protein